MERNLVTEILTRSQRLSTAYHFPTGTLALDEAVKASWAAEVIGFRNLSDSALLWRGSTDYP